jgi:hypothetical protein
MIIVLIQPLDKHNVVLHVMPFQVVTSIGIIIHLSDLSYRK